MTETIQNFLTIFIVVTIIAYMFEPNTQQSDMILTPDQQQIVYERDVFTMTGLGSTEVEACNNAAINANNECPYGATIQTKAKVKWVSKLLSDDKYWSCKAKYICKGK